MVLGRRFSLDSGCPTDVSADDVTGQRDTAGSRSPRPRLVLERLLGERTAVARSNGTVHSLFPVAVGAAEGEALRAWVQGENATRTIEIGLGYGIAALFVCEGLLANGDPAARHVAVDPYQATRFANCGLQFLDEAGVAELVEFHPEESELALPRFVAEARSFDLAFVDGKSPVRRRVPRPHLPRPARARRRNPLRRRLPASVGGSRGLLLHDEPGVDARRRFH